MRIFSKLLFLTLLAGCTTGPEVPTGPLTENRYIPPEDFSRISEFFTGREPETDRIYVRSQPESRGGYYWIFPIQDEMKKSGIGEILLAVQIPGDPEIREFRLIPPRPASSGATLWIGLTGEDWLASGLNPISWWLRIKSREGTLLEERKSYLWKPDPVIETNAPLGTAAQ